MTDTDTPIYNIVGEQIALGPTHRDQAPLFERWFNDLEVMIPFEFDSLSPMTRDATERALDPGPRNDSRRDFTIYELSSARPIGWTNLHRISFAQRIGEFGICIGDTDSWNKGYGTEATQLVLDFAFTGLNLHSVLLSAFAYNERGIRTYEKAGFREVGRWRQAHWIGGRPFDVVFMDCLASEFVSPVLAKLMP
ncbi:MAG TPA: GNAT family protein [Chloroflexota bacterium]|nr:GNAT family protein [Chloroflexota bacterium]